MAAATIPSSTNVSTNVGSGSASGSTLEGTLSKWTNVMKGWQYRFFVLDENAGLLSYYTSKEKMMKGVRRGCVRLKEAVIGIDDQEDNTFTITVDHKTFHFQAQHSEEREKWVGRLEDTIRRHANRSKIWDSQNAFFLGTYNRELHGKRANDLELLARRVSEADAYLQLMIEQTNALELRCASITDAEEQAKCKIVQDNANAMLDHIKHSIVSLQIAKNMAHPINGIYKGPSSTNLSTATTATPTATPAKLAAGGHGSANPDNIICDDEDDSITDNGKVPHSFLVSFVTNIQQQQRQLQQEQQQQQKQQQENFELKLSSELLLLHAAAAAAAAGGSFEDITTIDTISDGIEYGTDLSCATASLLADGGATTAPLAMLVPETSYSSSEGEEDFYDAYDDPFTSLGNSPVSCATRGFGDTSPTQEKNTDALMSVIQASSNNQRASSPQPIQQTRAVPEIDEYQTDAKANANVTVMTAATTNAANANVMAHTRAAGIADRTGSYNNGIDYDALYEEEEDTDISMEAHGSMISHLLSQVKIGMDLTKVVLPTFILERRSLLEMYADYFAHPDLFLKIAELDTPRDRIVQVCRWYLSAYHAGRKSSVAKKPYNPIIGEVFQCHWDIPGESHDPTEVKDGPVPWCRRDQLTFLAEQVSHHPPISAFYAEHYNKKITFAAHVWTKSKFLGLSIGVHNIGEGIVTLVDRSEEYIVTFPNGYGRSILTVPWIELGGSVAIRCPQTGYYANVEFLTKPFYGGKRNKVTAEIYSPNDKKPFVSIAGEWSGLMEAKWHDKNKTEVFVDVNRIPIFKKQVRPIVEQEDYESRRIWKEVTAGLKFNDIERATNAKCEVEQAQRDQAKVRKEYDLSWEHKYFKPVGDNWIYSKPLSQRIYLQEKENKR